MSNQLSKNQASSMNNNSAPNTTSSGGRSTGKNLQTLLAMYRASEARARRAEYRRRKIPKNPTEVARAPFKRIARAIADRVVPDYYLDRTAITALHEVSEAYLAGLFTDIKELAEHARREKITIEDMQLVLKIRGGF